MPIIMRTAIVAATLTVVLSAVGRAGTVKFYSDDPIWHDPETQDASGVKAIPISDGFDLVENSFLGAGDRTDMRAVNVNTIDEVPDSSWFTNRLGDFARSPDRPIAVAAPSVADLVRGPDTGSGPAPGKWTVVADKSEGVTPGLVIKDAAGTTYFVKFDPPSNPEMASGAEVIATKFFHAFGYHVPENYIATVRADQLTVAETTRITDADGRQRQMKSGDVEVLLKRAARHDDGSYRVLASKQLPGEDVGRFRYYDTRPDDPNDIFPHEHRRELRGLSVFSAWLNHDEALSRNTLDTLVRSGARGIIRHHLIDFGSTLGSGSTQAQTARAGNEFVWEARPTFITMLTLGLYVRPWIKVDYPELPAIGRIEANYYQPQAWRPEYPNPAFRNARADDQFWAARIIAALSDDAVKAVVGTAKYTDPRASEYMTEMLLARKSKVLMTWLNATNPIVRPALSRTGALTFENAAEQAGVAKAAEKYTVAWSRLDNATGTHEPVGSEESVTSARAQAPAALLGSNAQYIAARLSAYHPDRPAWGQPVVVYFRRIDAGWKMVGLERNP